MDNQSSKPNETDVESSQLLESSKSHIRQAGDDLLAAGTAKLQELKDAAGHQGQPYIDAVKGYQDDVESFARKNPLKALASALGIGFVLGVLFRR